MAELRKGQQLGPGDRFHVRLRKAADQGRGRVPGRHPDQYAEDAQVPAAPDVEADHQPQAESADEELDGIQLRRGSVSVAEHDTKPDQSRCDSHQQDDEPDDLGRKDRTQPSQDPRKHDLHHSRRDRHPEDERETALLRRKQRRNEVDNARNGLAKVTGAEWPDGNHLQDGADRHGDQRETHHRRRHLGSRVARLGNEDRKEQEDRHHGHVLQAAHTREDGRWALLDTEDDARGPSHRAATIAVSDRSER